MHLRIYNEQTDFTYIASWIQDERTHALWCANLLSYPLSKDEFHNYLKEQGLKFNSQSRSDPYPKEKEHDGAYVYADDRDRPMGFFVFTVNKQDQSGFLRFIMVDSTVRGRGYGGQMLGQLLQYAYENAGVAAVRLLVFDVNDAAMKCYRKLGFTVMDNTPANFPYQNETWKRYMMEHRSLLNSPISPILKP